MAWTWLADAVLLLHAGFVAFVVVGALGVVWWPRLAWLHVPAVIWAAALELNGWICPLTPLENALRARGGRTGYAGGFIEHYLTAALYPEGLTRNIQLLLGVLVIVLNITAYVCVVRHARRRR